MQSDYAPHIDVNHEQNECLINNDIDMNEVKSSSEHKKIVFENVPNKKKPNNLIMAYTNTDILSNKLEEVEIYLHKNNIDVLCISEVNDKSINNKNCPDEVTLNNFVISGYDYIESPEGRGVGLFIKNNLILERCTETEQLFKPSIFGKIKVSSTDYFHIGLVYRSPNSNECDNIKLLKQFDSFTSKIANRGEQFIIMGDFNFSEIDWSCEACSKNDEHNASKFLNIFQKNFLTQFVSQPTHYRAQQTPTLIDLIISNDPDILQEVYHDPPFGMSHHSVLKFALNNLTNRNSSTSNNSMKFQINKGKFEEMREYMDNIDWLNLLSDEDNVDECWIKIENEINIAKNKFIPRVRPGNFSTGRRPFTAPLSLLQTLQKKRQSFKTYKKFPTTSNYSTYVKYRNQVKLETKEAKKTREQKVALEAKKNPKALFQYINSKTKGRVSIPDLIKPDGTLSTSDTEKCTLFNDLFASVFTQEGEGELPVFERTVHESLDTINISEDKVHRALNSLKAAKSPGPDEIHPRVLKELSEQLAYPLKILFNKTVKEGKIPANWKRAEVRPIFKKGSKQNPGNYRPVSLTSVVCKIFEGFIRDALYTHLITNNLLSSKQYGFCKGRSCVTQLLGTLHDWLLYLDDNIPVDCMYLDFRKAFDAVPHRRLLHKIEGYGVKGNVLKWVTDFLSNRSQYVALNDVASNDTPVTSGVPQGSVLGPTLFIYYINDLPEVVDSLIKIFADDTKSYDKVESVDDNHKLQKCIDNLVKWSQDWMLGFNCDKCKCLHLGKNNKKHTYTIQQGKERNNMGTTLLEKDLGVNIDPKLDFGEHINIQCKKAKRLSGMIIRTFENKTANILIPIFNSLIRPVIEYGNVVWSPYLRKYINKIERVQRNYTKNISGMGHIEYESRLRALKMPSLEYRRVRGDMIEVYKILNNIYDPITTHSLLTIDKDRITRGHDFKLKKHSFKTEKLKNFFTNRVNNLWNSLPDQVVKASSVNNFKNKLDSHLHRYKYSIHIDIWNMNRNQYHND